MIWPPSPDTYEEGEFVWGGGYSREEALDPHTARRVQRVCVNAFNSLTTLRLQNNLFNFRIINIVMIYQKLQKMFYKSLYKYFNLLN